MSPSSLVSIADNFFSSYPNLGFFFSIIPLNWFLLESTGSDQLAYLRSIFDDLGGDEGSFTDSPDVTDFPGVTDSPDVTDFPGDTDDTDTEGSGQNEIDDEDDVNDADNNPELN